MIEARELTKRYGDTTAVHSLSLWTAEDGSARSTVELLAEELGAEQLRWATATTTRTTRSQ